ncbi:hypothetical protein BC941DRAFT_467934 [Chlamydoabsidia padenii]|nr:hypothetical protein BC941DRAFT_467934 [Chlamydoabsidia padenii]
MIHWYLSQYNSDLVLHSWWPFIVNAKEKGGIRAQQCRQLSIPVNVADCNDLCDFYMPCTYRDQSLQMAVSTNGQASKLANRIWRHAISGLPAKLAQAVHRLGILSKTIQPSDSNDSTNNGILEFGSTGETLRCGYVDINHKMKKDTSLKQEDLFLFGYGEEVIFFRKHGYENKGNPEYIIISGKHHY